MNMESLFQPNNSEEHVFNSVYAALTEVRHRNEGTDRPVERQLLGAELQAARDVLDARDYDLPSKISLAWMVEPPTETALGILRSVEVGFIRFVYTSQTTLYVFTKDSDDEIFCDKEILNESQAVSLEEAGLEYLPEDVEREVEVKTEEISMLSEMMRAALSTHN